MGFFKSKAEKELDAIIYRLEMNMSNNYKDNAQSNLKELEEALKEMRHSGSVKEKILTEYESICDSYRIRLQGFTHQDQKPYWH